MPANALVEENDSYQYFEWLTGKRDFTWNNYVKWGEDVRVELYDGLVYMMASPDEWHQEVLLDISTQLRLFLKGKKCRPYIAPFDVRLFPEEDGSDKIVLQPDVFVVCDEAKTFGRKYCKGAPDFVIEVMSESSEGKDLYDKKRWYEKAGVKEYWVVSRDRLYVYRLGSNGCYEESITAMSDLTTMPVEVLCGCIVSFSDIKTRYGV